MGGPGADPGGNADDGDNAEDEQNPPWQFVGSEGVMSAEEASAATRAARGTDTADDDGATDDASDAAPTDGGQPVSRRQMARWFGTLLVVALVIGAGAVAVTSRDRGPGHPRQWDPRVAGLVTYVETARGLKFKHPVHVDFLTDAQFEVEASLTDALDDADRADLKRTTGELRALGLASGDLDLEAILNQLSSEGTIGLYVPKDRRVYMRGTDLTVRLRSTLVHELTHALQDQHFDLQPLQEEADGAGVISLIEGDAVRIEDEWVAKLSAAEAKEYEEGEHGNLANADLEGIPRFFLQSFSFPYVFGPGFVRAVASDGGNAAVDAAFRSPPRSEAEILNPHIYIERLLVDVPAPAVAAPDKVTDEPVEFGLATTVVVLGSKIGYQSAWDVVTGWQGDRAQSFEREGRACIAFATRMDTEPHAEALAAATTSWGEGRPDVVVTQRGTVVEASACDPGADAPAPAKAAPDPFDVLQVRASLLDSLVVTAGLSPREAACGADDVITTVGPVSVARVDAGVATADELRRLQDVAAAASTTCATQ